MPAKPRTPQPIDPEPEPFESSLERLEDVVERLERGELPLEEALALFEEGVGLARRLGEQLDRAEQRVDQLVEENGAVVARPFDEEPGEGS